MIDEIQIHDMLNLNEICYVEISSVNKEFFKIYRLVQNKIIQKLMEKK
jgi:hypothetical protein